MKDKFIKLRRYYESLDRQSNKCFSKNTEVGLYLPSNLRLMNKAMNSLVNNGLINNRDTIMDAGSGDGRIVSLWAGVYNLPTVGVEYDSALVQRSSKIISYLKRINIIEETQADIVQGNFNRDETYNKQGMKFADFSVIFNYINGQNDLAEKIRRQSPLGTKFLLLDSQQQPDKFAGLNYVDKIILNRGPEIEINPLENLAGKMYLHIYQK